MTPISGFPVNPDGTAGGVLAGTYPDPSFANDMATQAELDVAIAGVSTRSLVTSLPSSPANGQECYYQADATNGIVWHLRYNSASASTYKWECLGGPPLSAEVTTAESTTSATYTALATVGPSIAIPIGGEYGVQIGAHVLNDTQGCACYMSYANGGTPASDDDLIGYQNPAAGGGGGISSITREQVKALAVVSIVAKYRRQAGGTATFQFRWMRIRPIRLLG